MKILVFMSDNRSLSKDLETSKYNSLAAVINKYYCDKHGYDFIYYIPYLTETFSLYNCKDPATGELRHASWSKLLSTARALQLSYDYIVYIDSDCIFKNLDMQLETWISKTDKSLIFLNDKPWSETLPCAGFYILKVNEVTRHIINFWINDYNPSHNQTHPWEQSSLQSFYTKFNSEIHIIDAWMFKEEPGQFLRHIGSYEDSIDKNRMSYFLDFINKHNITYDISNIEIDMFNTDIIQSTPTFNVLIATIGRPTLQNMLDSLVNNLSKDDCLTIVYDGLSEIPKFDISKLKCTVIQKCEPIPLKYWGHGIRNKYASLLEHRTFVMHADDDNIYVNGAFDYLRKICTNSNALYITQVIWGNKNVIPSSEYIAEKNVDTACGVIPYDLNLKGIWLPRVGGDGSFYEQLITISPITLFTPSVIYIIRPHESKSQSSTVRNLLTHIHRPDPTQLDTSKQTINSKPKRQIQIPRHRIR